MPEITVYGANEMTFPALHTWGWEIALYLFLGGLVAGMMILNGSIRVLGRSQVLQKATTISCLLGFPALGVGLLLLFLDLASKGNVWRLYATFQVSSPMSWGSWILLVTMVLLALRSASLVPAPQPVRLLGLDLFRPVPIRGGEEERDEPAAAAEKGSSALATMVESTWRMTHSLTAPIRKYDRLLAPVCIVFGIGVGLYTGVLLSSIQARPLWDSLVLPPLFLASGLAGGSAYLCLFLPRDEHNRLVPFSIAICAVELLLVGAYAFSLLSGSTSAREAAPLLFGGVSGLLFWGVVVFMGLLVPAAAESVEMLKHRVVFLSPRVPPVLKLAGGLTLRFVIVYAGLRGFA